MPITAKNYAASAQKEIRSTTTNLLRANDRRANFGLVIDRMISDAVHFAIPDGGKVFDDGLRGIAGQEIRLPYKAITVEFIANECKHVVCACETGFDNETQIIIACCADVGSGWVFLPFLGRVIGVNESGGFICKFADNEGNEPTDGTLAAAFCAESVLELIEALSCANVYSEPIEHVSDRVNERRVRDGKTPIFETRRLMLKIPSKISQSREGIASDRKSPAEHLRRGHIRVIDGGKRIWVNSCVVGRSENGRIDKQYSVIGG